MWRGEIGGRNLFRKGELHKNFCFLSNFGKQSECNLGCCTVLCACCCLGQTMMGMVASQTTEDQMEEGSLFREVVCCWRKVSGIWDNYPKCNLGSVALFEARNKGLGQRRAWRQSRQPEFPFAKDMYMHFVGLCCNMFCGPKMQVWTVSA